MSTATPTMPDLEKVNGKNRDWIWHLFFGVLTAATLVFFIVWGNGEIAEGSNRILLVTAIIFALFMACLLYTSPSPRD